MAQAIMRMALSKKKQRAFLTALILNGGLAEPAARDVGYTSTAFLRKVRRDDDDFAEAWEEAIEAAGDLIEAEVYRRAIHGTMEPVYFKGTITGYIRKYSDRLAELLLKRHRPEYRDRGVGGEMNINVGVAVMPSRAVSDGEWEARAEIMHQTQDVVVLEDKPKTNLLERTTTVKRGD